MCPVLYCFLCKPLTTTLLIALFLKSKFSCVLLRYTACNKIYIGNSYYLLLMKQMNVSLIFHSYPFFILAGISEIYFLSMNLKCSPTVLTKIFILYITCLDLMSYSLYPLTPCSIFFPTPLTLFYSFYIRDHAIFFFLCLPYFA